MLVIELKQWSVLGKSLSDLGAAVSQLHNILLQVTHFNITNLNNGQNVIIINFNSQAFLEGFENAKTAIIISSKWVSGRKSF